MATPSSRISRALIGALALLFQLIPAVRAQDVLLREVISRETSLMVGGLDSDPPKQIASREISLHVPAGAGGSARIVSREVDLLVVTGAPPPKVSPLLVSISPTGDSAEISWLGYPQWAVGDITRFEIYLSDTGPITDVTGLVPVKSVGGSQTGASLAGLATGTDHYFAVVAVDGLENRLTGVDYAAAYLVTKQLVSREISLFTGQDAPVLKSVVSREIDLAMVAAAPPLAVTTLTVKASPDGSTATLDWTGYNPWKGSPVVGYDIYYSTRGPILSVAGLVPIRRVPTGDSSVVVDGLTPGTDHYFAVVPVDPLGNYLSGVTYGAAYVISPQAVSRELSISVGSASGSPDPGRLASREISLVVADSTVPPPVTGLASGFLAGTSPSAFGAVDLVWPNYNELAAIDVARYRIYVGSGFFESVSGMEPYAFAPAGKLAATITGLGGNSIRHFAVVAEDASGNINPNVRSASAQSSISGVGEVRSLAAVSGQTSLAFSWQPPPDVGAFLQGYRIHFAGLANPVNLDPAETSWSINGLAPGAGYAFRISTVDAFGEESDGISLLATTLLTNPGNLRLTTQGTSVVLSWDSITPSTLVSYYEIYRSGQAFTDTRLATLIGTTTQSPSILGSFESVSGNHFAVVAVNSLGASQQQVLSIEATKQSQSVDFPLLAIGSRTIPLVATASSGLPIVFSATPGTVAAVENGALSVRRGGLLNVTAAQPGDNQFWPASSTQSARIPPVLENFAANGVPLVNGVVLTSPGTRLSVDALDAIGISQAEFQWGGPDQWTALGVDATPGDGLALTFQLADLPVSATRLRVVVRATDGATAMASAEVVLAPGPRLTIALAGPTVVEGESLAGTVSLDRARAADLSVTLSTSQPLQLNVGTPVVIPAGQRSAPITITARQDFTIEAPTEIRVTAGADAAPATETQVTLLDDDWPVLGISLDRTVVPESAGANAALATVTRQPVTPEAVTVWLAGPGGGATFPASAVIPAGQGSVSFPIGVNDDSAATGDRQLSLTAEVRVAGYGVVSTSPPALLTVTDDEGPRLELEFSRGWILAGGGETAILRRVGGGNSAPLVVSLASSDPAKLAVPATVTLPAGVSEMTFVANSIGIGGVVRITASASGWGPAQSELSVIADALPDLAVSGVVAVSLVNTEAMFQVSYRLENRGASPAVGPFVQRILLSSDPVLGDDVLLAQSAFSGTLNAGVGFDRTETVFAPRATGSYWIFVTCDVENSLAEISEANNTVRMVGSLEVRPAYTASVATDASVVATGTPLVFTGTAEKSDGSRVPNALVNIHIRVAGTSRVIAALTNSAGIYSVVWKPLPGEGGDYQIGAVHPGVTIAPTQDTFSILNLSLDFPSAPIVVDAGGTAELIGTLSNPTSVPLDGLSFVSSGSPSGTSVSAAFGGSQLNPGASTPVTLTWHATADAFGATTARVSFSTTQGAAVALEVPVTVRRLVAELVVVPDLVKTSVLRGEARTFAFRIENHGGAASGALDIVIPSLPWLSLATPGAITPIPAGGSASVTLVLAPGTDVPLTLFRGTMSLIENGVGARSIPFEFRVVSALTGDLRVDVVDEAFYFTTAAPKVAGALVTVRDAVTGEEVTAAVTGADGTLRFPNLPEGYYTLDIGSPDHSPTKTNIYLNSGEENLQQVFISREWVKYSWSVQEIELQDRYRVTVESTFETNVPAPVVTVTPGVLDLEDLTLLGQTKVINFTMENHGLIHAENGRLSFGSHPFYEVTPLIGDVGTLPAKSSITIPVVIRRIAEFADDGSIRTLDGSRARLPRDGGGVGCGFGGSFTWSFECGPLSISKTATIPASGADSSGCGGGAGGAIYPRGGGGGAGYISVGVGVTLGCDPTCLALAALGCVPGPVGCFFGGVGCGKGLAEGGLTPLTTLDCAVGAAGCLIPPAAVPACVYAFVRCFVTPGASGKSIRDSAPRAVFDPIDLYKPGVESMLEVVETITGSPIEVWINPQAGPATGDWFWHFQQTVLVDSPGGRRVTAEERADLMDDVLPAGVPVAEVTRVIDRWNRTIDNVAAGIARPLDAPAGTNLDFIDTVALQATMAAAALRQEVANANGYRDSIEAIIETLRIQQQQGDGAGVCAKVRLRLDQEAVMTRSAFRGNLELANNRDQGNLTGVGFDLNIRDAAGNDASDSFNIRITRLDGIDVIDGTGVIGPSSAANVQWTLIPRDSAAPIGDTVYQIGGTIRYQQGGTAFTIPIVAVPITVRPDAALYLKYFHQRDVYSDDPFTDPIEPAVPYSLAVMVENRGAGAARKLSITSAQPKIVENEKGLLIDFKIIATQVAGQNLTPSLTADFGDLAMGQRKVATWLLTSSLQGLFIDYAATFEHLDGFGDERISLIKEVSIHELIREFDALGSLNDGTPDFLVNDEPDARDLPDTVHLSDGSTAPVAVVEHATISGANAQFIVAMGAGGTGWRYLRIPDPSAGALQLTGVVRSDGRVLPLDRNIWVTDRTFYGLGKKPVNEWILHLIDDGGDGTYTLVYGPKATDTIAPTSRIAALPADSPPSIPVRWSGEDGGGIARFDVWVAEDGGAFSRWLTNTTRTSGVYEGNSGHRYGFYVVATDYAGNVESKPASAEKSTLAGAANLVPTVEIPQAITVVEGETARIEVIAHDSDGPASGLKYAVSSSASGLVIDPLSGILSWVTGEADGGRTVQALITVRDSGFPPASQVVTAIIHVAETNSPPVVGAIAGQTVGTGELLVVVLDAKDFDFPVQRLSFRLGEGMPAGMRVDSSTGVFTWQPDSQTAGQTVVAEVVVADSGNPAGETRVAFPITVQSRNDQPPSFGMVKAVLWVKGRNYAVLVQALDPDGDPVTITANTAGLPGSGRFSSVAGSGSGTLGWDTTGADRGIFQVPLYASSGGLVTHAVLSIRIEDDDLYWNWAVEALDGITDPEWFAQDADPDGDGRQNLHEMVFLTQPLVPDQVAVSIDFEEHGGFSMVELSVDRRVGADAYVKLSPARSTDLARDSWRQVDPTAWDAVVDPPELGGDPDRETVRFHIYGLDAPPKEYFRIESRPRK